MKSVSQKSLLIIGTVGSGPHFSFGGSDKIHGLVKMLSNVYGRVDVLSTAGWQKSPISILKMMRKQISTHDDVLSVFSINGTKYLLPIVHRWCKKFHKRCFYAMIGIGNLQLETKIDPEYDEITTFIQNKSLWKRHDCFVARVLSKMDAVFVETDILKEMCEVIYGLNNAFRLDNGRDFEAVKAPISLSDIDPTNIKFVYFAAISIDKGADIVISAADALNKRGITNFSVDLYGRISDVDRDRIFNMNFPKNVNYRGIYSAGDKIHFLSSYQCMLFASRSFEGTPGTIVDARYAGLPVISSNFSFANEIVSDGIDGLIFERKNPTDLADKIEFLIRHREIIPAMSIKSVQRSSIYSLPNIKEEFFAALESIE